MRIEVGAILMWPYVQGLGYFDQSTGYFISHPSLPCTIFDTLFPGEQMNTNTYVIRADNIWKKYGAHTAVSGLSFSVKESTCFGLLGPNGAGKTTMMKMIYGVATRTGDKGSTLSVFGHDPQSDSLAIKFISGVVPQENNLDEELNVEQNLKVFARFYNVPVKTAQSRIDELLAFMELGNKHKARIKQLSGGMKRRLIIARALLNNPKLLILDEPTTGLDPQVRHLIWDKLRLLKRQGMTILLTTHYMEEAFQICDNVVIMNKGQSVMEGNPQMLVGENIEPYVMEVYSKELFAVITDEVSALCCRVDSSADVIRIYSKSYEPLRDLSKKLTLGGYHLRQSNLEDLFLKATGSSLNAQQ
ncbi:ABC transporter ATP-binding protein [Chitinispirillales bacterium ANBcel5]|uniref:ABC transporter ATP-binding protein n=1 Tax=Cellulosispirillum alkaliphilum TaxID=3039283 RepID=UPI002A58C49D|nr:ABC transporter ATP-binding protein [Chitinispirillales bacterium ANBcel5]